MSPFSDCGEIMCMNPIHRGLLIKEHTRLQQTLICEFRTFVLWSPLTTVAMRQAEEHHRKSHHACKQAIPMDGRDRTAPPTLTSSPKCSGANKCPRLPHEDSREMLQRT